MSCTIPANPDVSGIGVRVAIYIQNILCFVPAVWAIWDGRVSDYELECAETHSTTNLVLAFAILISCIFQAIARGLTNYHASIVLGLSWMNNTNAFVYFLLYLQHKSQGGAGGVEPTLSSWIHHIENRLLTILCVPKVRKNREPVTNAAKNAAGVLFKRIALFLGSLHLTLMAALGIWLWSSPQAFGAIESAMCATQVADLAVLGVRVRFGSQVLRIVSLTIYSLLLVPGINLLLPMAFFLGFHCWYHSRRSTEQTLPQHNSNVRPLTLPIDVTGGASGDPVPVDDWRVRLKQVLPVCVGLGFLLAVNIAFMTDVELTLRRNGGVQESGESDWGFGQILAILLVFMPLRDLTEAIIRRRQEMQTRLNEALKKAIGDENLDGLTRWLNVGADPNVKADSGLTALQTAVRLGSYNTILLLVDRGADVNAPFNDGSTALEAVARLGNHDTVSLLVNRGADVNAPFSDGSTALQTAVRLGNHDTILLLVDRGADVNAPFNDGSTALEAVARLGNHDIVSLLVHRGANVNAPFSDGSTALQTAVRLGNHDTISLLLNRGVDVNGPFNDRSTAWQTALLHGKYDTILFLFNLGADLNRPFNDGTTTPEMLALGKRWSALPEVIRAGAAVNKPLKDGQTMLEFVSINAQWNLAKDIITAGTDVNIEFSDGRTLLEVAILAAETEESFGLVQDVVKAGANVNKEFSDGRTALQVAALASQWDIVRILVTAGASINEDFRTLLEVAIRAEATEESTSLIQGVLKAGADVNREFSGGTTALEAASLASNWDLVCTLVAAGASVNKQFSDGRTALEVAALAFQWDIVRILVTAGASVNEEFKAPRRTLLEVAIRAKESDESISLIQDVLKAGADVNREFSDGTIALEAASLASKWDFVHTLVAAGASVNRKFSDGRTALEVAALAFQWDIVRILVTAGASVNEEFKAPRRTLLEVAIRAKESEESISLIQDVLKAGADAERLFSDGTIALEAASLASKWDFVRTLVAAGASVNRKFSEGRTALQVAALAFRWDIVRILSTAGASINEDFRTLLEVAIRAEATEESTSLIQGVLEAGADVNKEFSDGTTALELATLRSKWDFVRILVMAGASGTKEFKHRDVFRETCLNAACFAGREDVVTFLLQHNANPDGRAGMVTPLYCASVKGNVTCIKALLDGGANVNIQDSGGWTCLHGAGHLHQVDCLKVLLEHGGDASIRNNDGRTALWMAKRDPFQKGRFSEISDLFRSCGVTV